MKTSVVICTHNRLRYLDGLFASLLRQTAPREQFEIILVDNVSVDGTRAWSENAKNQAKDGGVSFTYIYEQALGLNHARNAGWRAAQSELVAYIDDDAIAAPHWLKAIQQVFQRHSERLAAVGGKIEPLWESPPPEWLAPELWPYLSVLDLSPEELIMEKPQCFVGANMAIRKSALERVGGFRPNLDRQGKNLLSNGEVHLKRLLDEAGYYSVYDPQVLVQHSVPRERMTKKWFRRRSYWQGVSDAFMQPGPPKFIPWTRSVARNTRASLNICGKRIELAIQRQQPELGWYRRAGCVMGRWQQILGIAN